MLLHLIFKTTLLLFSFYAEEVEAQREATCPTSYEQWMAEARVHPWVTREDQFHSTTVSLYTWGMIFLNIIDQFGVFCIALYVGNYRKP